MKRIFSNIIDFQNAVKNANPGDELELSPGVYDGSVSLDYRDPGGKITVNLHGVEINGDPENKREKYGLGLMGNNIDVFAEELKLNGGNSGALGVLGHNLKIVSDLKGYVTGHRTGCLEMGTNHHIQGLNFDSLGDIGISAKGFRINDDANRTYNQNFGWYPANNWRITQCIFQNIAPPVSGDAGGGVRIIPHAKNVMVDNCIFRKIKGSGLWGDHNQKGFEWYYNLFEDIETAESFGKAVFLEIADPDPNDKSGFVAKIAGNIFRRCDNQTILIAASSGQNPRGIDVFGNTIEEGWGIVAGAMQRQFKRKWDFRNPGSYEYVDARLENIRIRKNVIRQTTGRNHIAIFQGRNSGLIEVDSNYYVTGHEYNWERPDGQIETKTVMSPQVYASETGSEGLFIHGISNAADRDKNSVFGAMPNEFPFPEVWAEIPVERVDISTGVITPIPDPVIIPDPTPTPEPQGLPDVWVFTDYSEGDTDPDDHVAMSALLMTHKERMNLLGVTVGCYPTVPRTGFNYKYDSPLDLFENTHLKAYKDEIGTPSFQALLADSWRKRFNKDIALSAGSKVIEVLEESTKPIYFLSWGILTEIAHIVEEILNYKPELLERVFIVSHYTEHATDNNYFKDSFAAEYLKGMAEKGELNFIELGSSGVKIDDKLLPKLSKDVLKSKLGFYFSEKWKTPVNNLNEDGIPDFSDFATVIAVAFPELGFGIGSDWWANVKMNNSSNLEAFNQQFGSQKGILYAIIEERASQLIAGGVITPPPPPDNSLRDEIDEIRAEILTIYNRLTELRDTL